MGRNCISFGFFDLLPFNDPDIPTLLHRFFGGGSSSDVSFAPASPALSCSLELLQDFGSDYLPITLTIPLSPIISPDKRLSSLNYQKARLDDFAFHFDTLSPSSVEYSSLSLSSAVAHKNDEDCHAHISASWHVSSVIFK